MPVALAHCSPMLTPRLIAVQLAATSLALATPYSAYNSFNNQLARAYAVPQTTTTYTRTTMYSSSSTVSNTPNTPSSRRGAFNPGGSSRSEGNSWAMPSRQEPFSWGPGAREALPDPVHDSMMRLVYKARGSDKRPNLLTGTELQFYDFYVSWGVRHREALEAADDDYREGTRLLRAAHDEEQRRAAIYMAQVSATRAQYNRELQVVKRRALAIGDVATAQAWLDFAHPSGLWRGAFIEHNAAEKAEASLHAAKLGIPEGIMKTWSTFRRDDPAGFIWRDQAVALGSLLAMDAVYKIYAEAPVTNYAAVVALFEKSYPQLPSGVALYDSESSQGAPSAQCAYILATLYAKGDATLPADGVKSLAWARRLPPFWQQQWRERSHLTRVNALGRLMENPAAAQSVEKELVAEWLELARLEPAAPTYNLRTQSALADIFSGTHPAFPHSKDPVQAEAAFAQVQQLATRDFATSIWLMRYCNRTGEWDRAGETADFGAARANSALAYEIGLYWRNRTDGKADTTKALAYLEKARAGARLGSIALAETYLKLGRYAEAEKAILERNKNNLVGFDLYRSLAHLCLLQVRGEFKGNISDRAMLAYNEATTQLANVSTLTAEQRAYVRDFEFEYLALPFLARHQEYNRRDRELDARLEEMALHPAQTDEEKKVHAENLADITDRRRINASYRPLLFEEVLPKLYAMSLDGYEPAQRLWAWVALSGQVSVSENDAHTAKTFLYSSAREGDMLSIAMLGQLLFQDTQRLAAAQSTPQEKLAGLYAEAADWLEAARQNGAPEVRWPLVAVYREGLGREKSPEKVAGLLESLAESGDVEARAQLAQTRS